MSTPYAATLEHLTDAAGTALDAVAELTQQLRTAKIEAARLRTALQDVRHRAAMVLLHGAREPFGILEGIDAVAYRALYSVSE